ncbi:hypothetical protein L6Q96_19855 [Candidatus Binatia bacterium]|nr:hypothetical protein [Candidatus Binatia bacterium]
MMDVRKMFAGAVATGAVALAPALAHAYTGPLITCNPTVGSPATVEFSPGLACAEAYNKIKIPATVVDNCSTPVAAATWTSWGKAAGKVDGTALVAGLGGTGKVSVALKGSTYGSCNFGGSATSFTASTAAKVTVTDSAGNKLTKGAAYTRIAGDAATFSAQALGVMTKGVALGAKINIQLLIDSLDPANANLLSCNLDYANCGLYVTAPEELLTLKTDASSYLEIYVGGEDDCTAAGVPFKCCGGLHPHAGNTTCQGA